MSTPLWMRRSGFFFFHNNKLNRPSPVNNGHVESVKRTHLPNLIPAQTLEAALIRAGSKQWRCLFSCVSVEAGGTGAGSTGVVNEDDHIVLIFDKTVKLYKSGKEIKPRPYLPDSSH